MNENVVTSTMTATSSAVNGGFLIAVHNRYGEVLYVRKEIGRSLGFIVAGRRHAKVYPSRDAAMSAVGRFRPSVAGTTFAVEAA